MKTNTLDKHKETILSIIKNFKTPKGLTDWRRAFKENPEWEKELSINTGADRQRLYVYLNKLKSKGEIQSTDTDEARKKRKREYQRRFRARQASKRHQNNHQESSEPQPQKQEFALRHIKFCPMCSCNLEAVEMALRLVNK